jgi:hypothetical protein
LGGKDKVRVFVCQTEEEKNDWVSELQTAIQRAIHNNQSLLGKRDLICCQFADVDLTERTGSATVPVTSPGGSPSLQPPQQQSTQSPKPKETQTTAAAQAAQATNSPHHAHPNARVNPLGNIPLSLGMYFSYQHSR